MKRVFISVMLFLSTLIFSKSNQENISIDNAFLEITDYRERVVLIQNEPNRIISLAPNISEIIFKLGGDKKLVGRTDYCDYPKEVESIPSIGTILNPSIEKIIELNPDLIIGSTHFSYELLVKLEELNIDVVIIDELGSIEGIYKNIRDIGLLLNREDEADREITFIKKNIYTLSELVKPLKKPSIYYAISFGEYGDFTAGGDTFISELIELAGGENIAYDSSGWSYSIEKIIQKNPEIIICSKYNNTLEGLKKATGYKEIPAVKNNRVFPIDNDLIDRQGPRVSLGLEELIRTLHPELFNEKDR